MSKNIKRDSKGHAILPGAILYRYSVKPKARKVDTTDLKNRASERLFQLMKRGARADRLAHCPPRDISEQEQRSLDFQREFADAPRAAQFAYHNNKLQDLRQELEELEESGNKRKLECYKPFLEQQIVKEEETMRELYIEIKNERRVVTRVVRKES